MLKRYSQTSRQEEKFGFKLINSKTLTNRKIHWHSVEIDMPWTLKYQIVFLSSFSNPGSQLQKIQITMSDYFSSFPDWPGAVRKSSLKLTDAVMGSLSGPGSLVDHTQLQGLSFTFTIALDFVYRYSCLYLSQGSDGSFLIGGEAPFRLWDSKPESLSD